MALPKSLPVDWFEMGCRVGAALESVPSEPAAADGELPPLQPATSAMLQKLAGAIAYHLSYRLRVVHKLATKLPDGTGGMVSFDGRDPHQVMRFYKLAKEGRVELKREDLLALDAALMIGRLLQSRLASAEWKWKLPVYVAGIAGPSTGEKAQRWIVEPRARRRDNNADLRDAKRSAANRNPEATWKNLLDTLEGDEFVTRWTGSEIEWTDEEGKQKVTLTSTFKNWK